MREMTLFFEGYVSRRFREAALLPEGSLRFVILRRTQLTRDLSGAHLQRLDVNPEVNRRREDRLQATASPVTKRDEAFSV